MSRIWFSADSHFGHKNIINYCDRPFSSVAEMDGEMIENWNEVVAPEDEVYHLGDFSLDFKRMRQIVPLLRGHIHLIAGNHDLCHSSRPAAGSQASHYKECGFVDVCQSKNISINGTEVLLSHLPYYSLTDPDTRYQELKPNDEGLWLLHGHVHQRWKVMDRQINVGVDVWDFYPVSQAEIARIISGHNLKNEDSKAQDSLSFS